MAVTQIKDGYQGGSDNQLKVNSDGSINVNGSSGGGNASVGSNGTTAPTSSTQIGGKDPIGNLVPVNISSDGRVQVDAGQIFGVQTLNIKFNEVAAIAVGVETTINTYTPPVGVTAYLLSILNSGGNVSIFNIYNNGVLFDKQYTNLTIQSALFDYKTGSGSVPGMVIAAGHTITVTVINSGSDATSFNSRFMILEVT